MKIIVADDHAMTRAGISNALAAMFPAAQVAEFENAEQVMAYLEQQQAVELAVVDLFMPGNDGFGFLKKLCYERPELTVVVLSATDNPKYIRKVIDIGAAGFIHKSASFEQMQAAIKKVLEGGTYLPEALLVEQRGSISQTASALDNPLLKDELATVLTRRQKQILGCLAAGMSNKKIAEKLFISENTVKTHLKYLFAELGCKNRAEAAVLAEKAGMTSE